MKILVLCGERYPTNRPMIRELWNEELPRNGIKPFWVMQGRDRSFKVKKIDWNGNEVFIVPYFGQSGGFVKFINLLLILIFKFAVSLKVIISKRIKLIHVHNSIADGLVGLILSLLFRIKLSFTYTFPFVEKRENLLSGSKGFRRVLRRTLFFLYLSIYKIIFRRVGIIFLISGGLKELICKRFKIPEDKMLVAPEAASRTFLNFKKEIRKKDRCRKIIYIGSLSRYRKVVFLVDAFEIVYRKYKNVILVLLGWGENPADIPHLKAYISGKDFSKNILIMKEVDYEEVPKIVSSCDIGLSAIPPEDIYLVATPTKCVDYLSLGLPVVVNEEIDDQKELVIKSNAGFITKYDVNKYADAILRLLSNKKIARYLGESGNEWIKNNRTYEILARKISDRLVEFVSDI